MSKRARSTAGCDGCLQRVRLDGACVVAGSYASDAEWRGGVTVVPSPVHVELAERAARPDFETLQKQLRSSGYCARPVLLKGHVETCGADGRWRSTWSTRTQPDGVLRKACGNRREAVCPACAERYRQDAYHLIAAGLRGGKGVPDSVTDHPLVFATLDGADVRGGALARDRSRRAAATVPAAP